MALCPDPATPLFEPSLPPSSSSRRARFLLALAVSLLFGCKPANKLPRAPAIHAPSAVRGPTGALAKAELRTPPVPTESERKLAESLKKLDQLRGAAEGTAMAAGALESGARDGGEAVREPARTALGEPLAPSPGAVTPADGGRSATAEDATGRARAEAALSALVPLAREGRGREALDRYLSVHRTPSMETLSEVERKAAAVLVHRALDGWVATQDDRTTAETLLRLKDAAAGDSYLRPGSTALLTELGRRRFAANDLEAAKRYARWVLELDDAHPGAYALLGALAYQANELDEALDLWERGLRRNPEDAELQRLFKKHEKERSLTRGYANRSSAHFTLSFEGRDDYDIATRTLEALEEAYKQVGTLFDFYPTDKVPVVLYTDAVYRGHVSHTGWSAGQYDGKVRMPVGGGLGQSLRFKEVLFHEYAHAVFHRMTRGTKAPTWLNEGLAQVAERRVTNGPAPLCPESHGAPLRALEESFSRLSAGQASLAYPTAWHGAERLVERFGMARLRELLNELPRSGDFRRSFERTFDVPYERFVAQFDAEQPK